MVNGKVVYLFKVADQLNSKLLVLSSDLKKVDDTFPDWQNQLKMFSNKVQCHDGMTMEFPARYTVEINRAFTAFLRLFEAQDILNQVSRLNGKTLATLIYLNLFRQICLRSPKLQTDSSYISALEEGLSVLTSPLVDMEHDGRDLNVNMLFLVSEHFCVIELTLLKFNL